MRRFNLSPLQNHVLSLFAESELSKHFYWTGGTALSYYYLQHRYSDDLDFFSDTPFSYLQLNKFINELKKNIPDIIEITQQKIFERNVFIIQTKKNEILKIDFLHFDYPALDRRESWNNVFIDSLKDIAANKTLALMERHEPKDVVDIYFLIINKNFSPEYLLMLVHKKFLIQFPISNFIDRALLAVQNVQNIRPYIINNELNIEQINEYFEKLSFIELKKRFFN